MGHGRDILCVQVHLILRHKAPNGTIEEKHLKFPPSVELDKGTHVYTAILYPSNNSCAPALSWDCLAAAAGWAGYNALQLA